MAQAKELYTETVIEHCQKPRHFHKMEQPDRYGKVTGCGGPWPTASASKVRDGKRSTGKPEQNA
jgi:NifU-like protein involved in Fe-S cluster formation